MHKHDILIPFMITVYWNHRQTKKKLSLFTVVEIYTAWFKKMDSISYVYIPELYMVCELST
jgi:hypothetical protein